MVFVGNAPSTLKLLPGDHTTAAESSGFKTWQRTVTLSAGSDVTVSATLERRGSGAVAISPMR